MGNKSNDGDFIGELAIGIMLSCFFIVNAYTFFISTSNLSRFLSVVCAVILLYILIPCWKQIIKRFKQDKHSYENKG